MRKWLIVAVTIATPVFGFSQSTDSLSNKLDSLKKQTDTVAQVNLTEPDFYNERTTMNGKVFGVLLLNDFKQQALSPLEIKGRGWGTGAVLVATTVAASFLDKPIQKAAITYRNDHPGIGPFSRTVTNIGGIYQGVVFGGIATYGFVFNNPKLRTTTALATQSYLTSWFWSTAFKNLSGRLRPQNFEPGSAANSPKFHGPFYTSNSSFPSQHATLAFAAARVYALEYKHIAIVPIIAYSMAGLISVSRIVENKHWTTDIIAGSLLGWACGTQVVNNYHRYAKLVRTGQIKKKKKKGDITFNLQYQQDVGMVPGVVYKFR
jgi:hypothetical protein